MFELQGKYASAKIFTDNIEPEAISQILNVLNQSFIQGSQIRIMPDVHVGSACTIGTTITIKNAVVPNLVGVDIGCGMLAIKLNTYIDRDDTETLSKLDQVIRQYVPNGFGTHKKPVATSDAAQILAPIETDFAMCSLGTLGGGNHFIELDDEEHKYTWLVIHSGSRHLGREVASYYQKLAWKNISRTDTITKDEMTRAIKEDTRTESLEMPSKDKVPKDLAYLTDTDLEHYLYDIAITQRHAEINRLTMASIIMKHMGWDISAQFTTTHNYIDVENKILRKGAVSAQAGEHLIIPMNMRDGSLICTGKGNPDWNYSAPHGAGRIMSRGRAKEILNMQDYKDAMKSVFTTSVKPSTLDESPMVYKPIDEIIQNVQDTVTIDTIIKPIYNFKAN